MMQWQIERMFVYERSLNILTMNVTHGNKLNVKPKYTTNHFAQMNKYKCGHTEDALDTDRLGYVILRNQASYNGKNAV